jgi:hypothetical protein
MVYRGGPGKKTKPCPACGSAIEFVVEEDSPVLLEAGPSPRASTSIASDSQASATPVETKPPFPEPPAARGKSSSAFWVIVPAVAAVIATGGLLTCGGLLFVLSSGGDSDEYDPAYNSFSSTSDPYDSSFGSDYSSTSYSTPIDTYSAPEPYVPTSYSPDPYAVAPTYVEPTYTQSTYTEPTYVEPAPAETEAPSFDTPLWNFADPASELVAAIERDEEQLVEIDAAILGCRVGRGIGDVEAQGGETPGNQLLGILFSVGAEAAEQQLLTERATVQARIDSNRAELVRIRGY